MDEPVSDNNAEQMDVDDDAPPPPQQQSSSGGLSLLQDNTLAPAPPPAPHTKHVKDGTTINEVATLTFQQLKSDCVYRLLATGNDEDKALAARAAQATTWDDLVSVTNAKHTDPANRINDPSRLDPDSELAQRLREQGILPPLAAAASSSSNSALAVRDDDDDDAPPLHVPGMNAPPSANSEYVRKHTEMVKSAEYEAYTKSAFEAALKKHGFVDPETGEMRLPDILSPEQANALGTATQRNVFVAKTLSPQAEEEARRVASFAPAPMAIEHKQKQADDGDDGDEDPMAVANSVRDEEEVRKLQQKIDERALAVVEARRAFNAVTEMTHTEVPFLGCDPRLVPWLQHAEDWPDYLPVTDALVHAALTKRAGVMRVSLAFSPMYPLCVYTPKLLMLLTGKKFGHAVSVYSTYQVYDALFTYMLGTTIRPRHAEFLDQELQAARRMQEVARENNDDVALHFVAAFTAGISDAMHAWSCVDEKTGEATPQLRSPYQRIFDMPPETTTGQRFTAGMVMRHSKEEIAHIVSVQKDLALERFTQSIEKLEAKRSDLKAKQFVEHYYRLQHVLCVELLNCYEIGLLFLLEDFVPTTQRFDLRTQPKMVTDDKVDAKLIQDVRLERRSFEILRGHAHETSKEKCKTKDVGAKLQISKLPNTPVDSKAATVAPSYRSLARFYNMNNMEYETQAQFLQTADNVNDIFKALDKTKQEVTDLSLFLQNHSLEEHGNDSDMKRVKK